MQVLEQLNDIKPEETKQDPSEIAGNASNDELFRNSGAFKEKNNLQVEENQSRA